MIPELKIIGIYKVPESSEVHLIELESLSNNVDLDLGKITQEQDGVDWMSWQVPYEEKYLNPTGTKIIYEYLEEPDVLPVGTRITFYFHFLSFKKPLQTQFGELRLVEPKEIPSRLSALFTYEDPT